MQTQHITLKASTPPDQASNRILPIRQFHWLMPGLTLLLVLSIVSCIALSLWKTILLGAIALDANAVIIVWLPNITTTDNLISTLISKSLPMNGLLWVLSLCLRRQDQDMDTAKALIVLSLMWNCILMLDLAEFSLSLIVVSSQVLKLAHLLELYPTAEGVTTALLHGCYLLVWVMAIFSLKNALDQSELHFHPDVFHFFQLGLAAYGGTLLFSFINSNAIAPTLQSSELQVKFIWAEDFFLKAAITFGLFGAFYQQSMLSSTSTTFSSLGFSHWFTLLLGLSLVFIISSPSGLSPLISGPLEPLVFGVLAIIWVIHLIYCHYGERELSLTLKLRTLEQTYLKFALLLFSCGFIVFAKNIIPNTQPHQIISLWLLTNNLYQLGALLLFIFVLTQAEKALNNTYIPKKSTSLLHGLRHSCLILGSILCILSICTSFYFQNSLEVKALARGIAVDYHEVYNALQPLLNFYFWGLLIFLSGCLLQLSQSSAGFLRHIYTLVSKASTASKSAGQVNTNNPKTLEPASDPTNLKPIVKSEAHG